jgi:hypothetical protein
MTDAVPIRHWGRDHWSTLAYVGQRQEHKGNMRVEHMRCDPSIHPGLAHRGSRGNPAPTRLKGGTTIQPHDDWSCIDDMELEGLVTVEGTGIAPIVILTDKGWQLWFQLQRHIATNPSWSATFEPDLVLAQAHIDLDSAGRRAV